MLANFPLKLVFGTGKIATKIIGSYHGNYEMELKHNPIDNHNKINKSLIKFNNTSSVIHYWKSCKRETFALRIHGFSGNLFSKEADTRSRLRKI